MERRAFFAAIASPIIANGFPGPDADLKELHKRYLRAWREGSDREADALTFQLREPGPTPNRERSDLPHDWWPRQACWDRARALDLTEGLGARPRKHLAEVGGLFERSDFRSGFLANPVLHLLLASIPRSQHGLVSDWRGS